MLLKDIYQNAKKSFQDLNLLKLKKPKNNGNQKNQLNLNMPRKQNGIKQVRTDKTQQEPYSRMILIAQMILG